MSVSEKSAICIVKCINHRSLLEIPADASGPGVGVLVAVEHDEEHVCVRVDEVLGQQQIVVKPFPSYLGKVRRLSGCSILGDGSVCLILDVERLLESTADARATAQGAELAAVQP